MEIDLTPKLPQKIFSGEGGSYYSWSSSDLPVLSQAKVGGGKLILEPLGLALPHYADSSKIGYVVQGTGKLGMVLSKASEEKVVKIKKGDDIPVPLGAVSWWFNDGESELIVVFLGETSKAHHSGEFTYFLLAGAKGIFTGFSTEFVSRALDLQEEEANKLVKSQSGVLIIKLKEGKNMPEPCNDNNEGIIFNITAAVPDVNINNAGHAIILTSSKLPLLKEVGLSANHVKLNANAMCAPAFSSDAAVQVTYIVKGSGQVQIVGIDGERILDTVVKAGQLFLVPRFYVVSTIANNEGMEWFSIITMTEPIFSYLVGKTSLWNALSPQVIQASLNVTQETQEVFRSKMSKNGILIPPPK